MKEIILIGFLACVIACCEGNIEVYCADTVIIKVQKNTVDGFPGDDSTLIIGDSPRCVDSAATPADECVPDNSTDSYVWMLNDLSMCGGHKEVYADGSEAMSYKISRHPIEDNSVIRSTPCGSIEVTCSYTSHESVTNSTVDIESVPYVGQNKSLDGSFEAEMIFGVLEASVFNARPDAVYGLNEEVAVSVRLSDGNPQNFVMGFLGCWATKTEDPEDTQRLDLIGSDGCEMNTAEIRKAIGFDIDFQFRSFVWADMTQEFHVFCDVGVCDYQADDGPVCYASLQKQCGNKKKSSKDSNLFRRLTTRQRKVFVDKNLKK